MKVAQLSARNPNCPRLTLFTFMHKTHRFKKTVSKSVFMTARVAARNRAVRQASTQLVCQFVSGELGDIGIRTDGRALLWATKGADTAHIGLSRAGFYDTN